MRGDTEYLHLTIERALRGERRLTADQLAMLLARTPRGIHRALERLEQAGKVRREGTGYSDDPFVWSRCTLPVELWR